MDPGDLLSFLDGPGDLATPPSSGIADVDNSQNETNVVAQVRARRRGSKEGTPLRTTSCLSSTENLFKSVDVHLHNDLLPCAAFFAEGHFHLYCTTRRTYVLI